MFILLISAFKKVVPVGLFEILTELFDKANILTIQTLVVVMFTA